MKLTHTLGLTTVIILLAIFGDKPKAQAVKMEPPKECWTNTMPHSNTMKHRIKCPEEK